eukprot:scaffold4661_cov108-Cylindrotheca_fusiformis.AAC.3
MVRFVLIGNLYQLSKAFPQGGPILRDKVVHANLGPMWFIGPRSDCSLNVMSLGTKSIDVRERM